MSDGETVVDTSDSQILTAEYKDGHLQIVEVAPYEKEQGIRVKSEGEIASGSGDRKYLQLDSNKGLVQLDLLNLTLVRCEDGGDEFRLVTESEGADSMSEDTVTCVLAEDGDDQDNQEYVMVEGDQGPLVFLQSDLESNDESKESVGKKAMTPTEILEKAKALQKAKTLLTQSHMTRVGKRGRRRKGELPPPHELLSSPNFKLFLYSCKMCSFKCNAVKELTAHKASEHGPGVGKYKSGGARGSSITLQCARCPFRGGSHAQLMKHVNDHHLTENEAANKVSLDSKEVEEADVLVCGACGFESASRPSFRRHIEREHGATIS